MSKRKEPPLVLNMSDLAVKRKLMSKISTLSGLWELSLYPRKLTRSLNQNAYYWAAVCAPFTEWLREQCGDPGITHGQAHEALKKKILGTAYELGDVEIIPTSRDLDTQEFSGFIEKSAAWLAEFCGIVVLPSEMFYEQKDTLKQQLRGSLKLTKEKAA